MMKLSTCSYAAPLGKGSRGLGSGCSDRYPAKTVLLQIATMPPTTRQLKGITMQVRTTPRGLQCISFADQDENPAILEQTSGIDHANPTFDESNSSFVLLGQKDAPAKLSMDQVAELVSYLQTWLEDGKFVTGAEAAPAAKRSRRAS